MEGRSDDMIKFKLFLEEFTAKHNGPVTIDDPLPFRLITYRLTREEVEGECIEWVMEYLNGQNHCPHVYAAAIAKATVDAIQSSEISSYEDERDEDDGKLIEANGFARLVFSKVHRICEEWNVNMPTLDINPCIHQVSLEAVRNKRRKMEDKHVCLQDVNSIFKNRLQEPDGKHRSFYAVYDGHGGVDAAYYAAAHLHLHAIQHPDFVTCPTEALKSAFVETDKAFIQKAGREGLRSGSTGVAVVVEPDSIHLAWLGDSQALLMRNCQPVEIMDPHKPDREDEKKRIEDLGGCVVWFGGWRVNGSLAVSRSIGDPEYKPYVSSDADTAVIPLDGTEECLIVACDGLWDVITPQAACKAVKDYIKSGSDLSGIATKLVAMAKAARSHDNITVLVVFLNPFRVMTEDVEENESKQVAVEEDEGEESKKENAEEGQSSNSGKEVGQSSNSGEEQGQKLNSGEEILQGTNSGENESQSTNSGENEGQSTNSVENEGQRLNLGEEQNVSKNLVEGGSNISGSNGPQIANTNNNNISVSKNLARQERRKKIKTSRQKKGFIIKNGVNEVPRDSKHESLKGSRSQHSSPTSNSQKLSKHGSTPELIMDVSNSTTSPKPLGSRQRSLSKRAIQPVRRSSSTPPVQRIASSAVNSEDVTIAELGVNLKKLVAKSANTTPSRAPRPVQHRSMPISIKPKSLTRTRSLPRDPKLAAIMKNKLSAQSADVQR